jgi:hypothetical protein
MRGVLRHPAVAVRRGAVRRRLGRRRSVDPRYRRRPGRYRRQRLVVGEPPPSPRRVRRRCELRLLDQLTGMIAGGELTGTVRA